MQNRNHSRTILRLSLASLVLLTSTIARAQTAPPTNIEPNAQYGGSFENDESDVTLFRGAANNSWFPVYFNAEPEPGAKRARRNPEINLRPEKT